MSKTALLTTALCLGYLWNHNAIAAKSKKNNCESPLVGAHNTTSAVDTFRSPVYDQLARTVGLAKMFPTYAEAWGIVTHGDGLPFGEEVEFPVDQGDINRRIEAMESRSHTKIGFRFKVIRINTSDIVNLERVLLSSFSYLNLIARGTWPIFYQGLDKIVATDDLPIFRLDIVAHDFCVHALHIPLMPHTVTERVKLFAQTAIALGALKISSVGEVHEFSERIIELMALHFDISTAYISTLYPRMIFNPLETSTHLFVMPGTFKGDYLLPGRARTALEKKAAQLALSLGLEKGLQDPMDLVEYFEHTIPSRFKLGIKGGDKAKLTRLRRRLLYETPPMPSNLETLNHVNSLLKMPR